MTRLIKTLKAPMTAGSNAALLPMADADWLRDRAANFHRLAAGALPFCVAQEIERLAAKYERLAAALEDGVSGDASRHAADAADEIAGR